jgi:hypothetical protein
MKIFHVGAGVPAQLKTAEKTHDQNNPSKSQETFLKPYGLSF